MVAFAGHGVQFEGEKDTFFCPMDARLADRSTMVPLDDVYKDGKGGEGRNEEAKKFELPICPTWQDPGFHQTDEHPVVWVRWIDAVAFAEWLSRREGKTYRLPTEAEWEYACRAGMTTRYFCGDDPEGLAEVGSVTDGTLKAELPERTTTTIAAQEGFAYTSPVGRHRPNAWGLYDMHGNVDEWCWDWYDKDFYKSSRVDDPAGPLEAEYRVFRGGSWFFNPRNCRSAGRKRTTPSSAGCSQGLRLALVP